MLGVKLMHLELPESLQGSGRWHSPFYVLKVSESQVLIFVYDVNGNSILNHKEALW